ncbi:MAG TPA: ATP-binding protein [Caldithrix abyssi]|uniref:ATP-binding protein n=1 Tax=Caldithrix abyssi TaxID=187145 RepID=A0A7V1LMR0_CALAY|nr:ATP-binding protein [Caldithrix abyssi]
MFKRWIDITHTKSALIIGPRRSGKTTLLKALFPDYTYVTLDNLDYLEWAARDPKGLVDSLGQKFILDEIQRRPQLTIAAKYAIDNQNAHILMTGSSAAGLLDEAADTMAGRVALYNLPTACFGEEQGPPTHDIFNDTLDLPRLKEGQRALSLALTYGQFPEVLTLQNTKEKEELLGNYRDTYFIRDLMQLSNLENIEGLLSIFHHLARSLGSHLEVSNFAREAGMSHPTTKKYLNNLYLSQLTFRLYGYHYGPAKRFLKASKTYFADNGIMHSLGIPLSEGQILENFVIAEFEKRRKLGMLSCDRLFYYKSTSGREIDLIFEKDNVTYAIEIKATRQPSRRDVRNLIEFSKNQKKKVKSFLFYMGDSYSEISDIRIIPVAALYRARL